MINVFICFHFSWKTCVVILTYVSLTFISDIKDILKQVNIAVWRHEIYMAIKMYPFIASARTINFSLNLYCCPRRVTLKLRVCPVLHGHCPTFLRCPAFRGMCRFDLCKTVIIASQILLKFISYARGRKKVARIKRERNSYPRVLQIRPKFHLPQILARNPAR